MRLIRTNSSHMVRLEDLSPVQRLRGRIERFKKIHNRGIRCFALLAVKLHDRECNATKKLVFFIRFCDTLRFGTTLAHVSNDAAHPAGVDGTLQVVGFKELPKARQLFHPTFISPENPFSVPFKDKKRKSKKALLAVHNEIRVGRLFDHHDPDVGRSLLRMKHCVKK